MMIWWGVKLNLLEKICRYDNNVTSWFRLKELGDNHKLGYEE